MGRNVHTARFTFEERATAYRDFALKITPKIAADMEVLSELGAKTMVENIETNYQAPYSAIRYASGVGTAGRHETGTMADAVTHELQFLPGDIINGRFGWINDYLAYFGYQENGFGHVGGGHVIPMYALRDARTEVAPKFFEAMHAIARSVGKGVQP